MGVKELIKRILEEKENKAYRQQLCRRQISYGKWAVAAEAAQEGQKNGLVSGFIVFVAGRGRLAARAYEVIGSYFAEHPRVELLYGDEDVCSWNREGSMADRGLPWYKPDWSPELLDSFFYFGSVVAVRRELLEQISFQPEEFCSRGRQMDSPDVVFYEVEDFAVYEKAVHVLVESAGGYERGACCIGHVQCILFHGESRAEQEKFLKDSAYLDDLRAERLLRFRDNLAVRRSRGTGILPVLSIVIPSKDHPEVLECCLKGCMRAAGAEPEGEVLPVEIIVVDNGSTEENRKSIEQMIQTMGNVEKGGCRIRYVYRPMEFNFSRMCNLGAAEAQGELLLFLNDDVELYRPGTLEKMAAVAAMDGMGAVGLKLYYPDSRRIQHAGITNLPIGPVHKLQFLEDDRRYYYGANQGDHNMLAVTAACLMVSRDRYREVGGFAEDLKIAFNDVDFCFCLYEAGYRNVCMNRLWAYHHESLSRGDDESEEKLDRLAWERERLYERHPGLEGEDPYYSSRLNRQGLDTGIRPAYLTAGNVTQKALEPLAAVLTDKKEGQNGCPQIRRLPWERRASGAGYRQDACVMVRVEDCRGRKILGYGIVLGDNNACYERLLLLQKMEGGAERQDKAEAQSSVDTGNRAKDKDIDRKMANVSETGTIYTLRLEGQYRPDLEENMPDQKNVALCGFDVEIGREAIPDGRYRLGMAVRNRITGLRLMNWSNRFMEI